MPARERQKMKITFLFLNSGPTLTYELPNKCICWFLPNLLIILPDEVSSSESCPGMRTLRRSSRTWANSSPTTDHGSQHRSDRRPASMQGCWSWTSLNWNWDGSSSGFQVWFHRVGSPVGCAVVCIDIDRRHPSSSVRTSEFNTK